MRIGRRDLILVIMTIISIGLFLRTLIPDKPVNGEDNTFDYRDLPPVGKILLNVKWCNSSISYIPFEIKDKNLVTLYSNKTDEKGKATINLSKHCGNGTYYLKVMFTAHFIEGGNETRCTYVIFRCDTDSLDSLEVNNNYKPEIWSEEPSIKIR